MPLLAQPRFRRAQHPLAAWLNPKSNQHAMHDGSANANSHRGVRELKIARTDVIRHRNTVDIGIVTHAVFSTRDATPLIEKGIAALKDNPQGDDAKLQTACAKELKRALEQFVESTLVPLMATQVRRSLVSEF